MNLAVQSKNKSFEALLSRGVDSRLAKDILKRGHSLSSLSKLSETQLMNLGLSAEAIKGIHKHRPRIPTDAFNAVMFKSRWTCCVCRIPHKEVILHHIKEWTESRDHSEKNLAVICLQCHGKAHTKHQLSVNLDENALRSAKLEWERAVRASDARSLALRSGISDNSHCWYHINHQRIFSAAKAAGVDFKFVPNFRSMLRLGLVDKNGLLTLNHLKNEMHAYAHGDCMVQYAYVHEVMVEYLSMISLDNVSDYLDRGSIRYRVREGDTIFLQGAFTFKDMTKKLEGVGQERKLRRKVGDIEFVSTIDGWESTSTSAWGSWLRGRQTAGAPLKVRTINESDRKIKFKCTTLAIAFGLNNLKSRHYGNYG